MTESTDREHVRFRSPGRATGDIHSPHSPHNINFR